VIRVIAGKELRECRRDGRALAVAGLLVLLVLVSLVTGRTSRAEERRRAADAQETDRGAFLRQGEKAPHAVAHFGRMAYKPVPPLALFDPGASPYLGQVIWLEAHTQNPAMSRPAEDAPELRRLAELSAAGVLTLLVPLLLFVIGHSAFAAERESGTLRQVLSTGVAPGALFRGKLAVVAGIGVAASTAVVAASAALALTAPGASAADVAVRAAGLAAGYGLYAVACASVALWVSARSKTAASALLVLMALWAGAVVVLPRIAASAAARIHPTPEAGAFWADAADQIRARRSARGTEERRAAEARVLSRALGRDVTAAEAAGLDVNRVGLEMEVAEGIGAQAYAGAYAELHATYESQRRLRRFFSALSPAIALQHLSSALAGTDVAAHRHFALAAEQQRRAVIQALNAEMMLGGVGQGFTYRADADVWAHIPDVTYRPPTPWSALSEAGWDLVVVAAWCALTLVLARRAARGTEPVGGMS
jgi:ABC-2 type transport system permease protein